MTDLIENEYIPDYAVHPGEILEEQLNAIGLSQMELSERTGIALSHINEIISGKASVTCETALKLACTVRYPAHFWNNLQRLYDETQGRLAKSGDLAFEFRVSHLITNQGQPVLQPVSLKMSQSVH